jgi:hypothetical protein
MRLDTEQEYKTVTTDSMQCQSGSSKIGFGCYYSPDLEINVNLLVQKSLASSMCTMAYLTNLMEQVSLLAQPLSKLSALCVVCKEDHSLDCPQELATGHYPKPDESSPSPPTLFH